jgi:hypothetical protein
VNPISMIKVQLIFRKFTCSVYYMKCVVDMFSIFMCNSFPVKKSSDDFKKSMFLFFIKF